LVEGFVRTMEQTPDEFTGPVNLGNPTEFTMLELAQQVIELTESNSALVFMPLPVDDPKQRQPDITMARKELAWEPQVKLRDGLIKTISYFDGLLKNPCS
jgi:UDP-glucuronate decarboxylase